jgi:outer membrane protein assembly factor BamB
MNAHGRLTCLEAETGKQQWAVDVLPRFQAHNITWALCECLLVDGPRVIVTPGGDKALMAALDKQTGQTVWTTEPLRNDQTSNASPLLFRHAGQRIIANCSSGHVFAVDADSGKLLWTVPLKNTFGVNVAAPVYGADRIFCTTPYVYGTCYSLPAWPSRSQPEKVWSTSLDTCTGSLLFVDGLLYGSGYKKHKSWLCLDWKSGEIRYELKSLTTGAAVYADGRLYCLTEDGRVALLRPTTGRFAIDGEFRLLPGTVNDAWAHPVLFHGRLYLRYHDTLWCYEVRAR